MSAVIFTCISCRVAFATAEQHRSHYKSDWHRYNLKRKVAGLTPVSAEDFQTRVELQKSQTQEKVQDSKLSCSLCGKHFSTENAFKNHLQSKKHKESEAKEAQKIESEVSKQEEKNREKGLSPNPKHTQDMINTALRESLKGVGIRERSGRSRGDDVMAQDGEEEDTDSDVESWDSEDDEALGIEECLFCSKTSPSFEENLSHMTTKHSLFLPDPDFLVDVEGLIAYLGAKVGQGHVCLWCNGKGKTFHTAQSVQKHMLDKGHCRIMFDGDAALEYADFYDYRKSYPDHKDGEEDVEMEEEVEPEQLISDGFELVLPSGATIGHRSLARYYRQNLQAVSRTREKHKAIMPKLLSQYRALGWTGATGEIAVRRRQDLGYCQRIKLRHHMKIGVKANNLQKHFRSQNPI